MTDSYLSCPISIVSQPAGRPAATSLVPFRHNKNISSQTSSQPETTTKETMFNSLKTIFTTHLPSSPVISYTLSSGSVLIGVWGSPSSPAESPPRLSSRLRDIFHHPVSPPVAVPLSPSGPANRPWVSHLNAG